MKALVGISGGPRSLVTAWLLKKQGMQVRGVYLDLFSDEGARARIQEIEKKLGITVQIADISKLAGESFLHARKSAFDMGHPFDVKRMFHKEILFPNLEKLRKSLGYEKLATGHAIGLQEDPVDNVVRVVRSADSNLTPFFEVLGLSQDILSRYLAPVGAIPGSLLSKIIGEIAPPALTELFDLDWKSLEDRLGASDPDYSREVQVFTASGVILGRSPLRELRAGAGYQDAEDSSKQYRVINILPSSDRVIVQDVSEINFREFHFDQCTWFRGNDLGLKHIDSTLISESSPEPRMIRVVQFEGGKLRGVLSEPLKGLDPWIVRGESVLFVSGSEVLGGARVIEVK